MLLKSLEHKIAIERFESHLAQHPHDPPRDIEEFSGPPYTNAEQALIDSEIARNTLELELRDWVTGMGLIQYLLGPVALILSLLLLWHSDTFVARIAFVACTVSNSISIYLMIYRGYFESLGW